MSDLFLAQKMIIDKIKADVVGVVTVDNPTAISGLTSFAGLLPACIVGAGAATIDSEEARGNLAVEEQQWIIDIIVPLSAETEMHASTIAAGVIKALSSFNLGAGFVRPMRYAGRPEPASYSKSYAEFVLAFKVKRVVGL
jgi:hypothetical protein